MYRWYSVFLILYESIQEVRQTFQVHLVRFHSSMVFVAVDNWNENGTQDCCHIYVYRTYIHVCISSNMLLVQNEMKNGVDFIEHSRQTEWEMMHGSLYEEPFRLQIRPLKKCIIHLQTWIRIKKTIFLTNCDLAKCFKLSR